MTSSHAEASFRARILALPMATDLLKVAVLFERPSLACIVEAPIPEADAA